MMVRADLVPMMMRMGVGGSGADGGDGEGGDGRGDDGFHDVSYS